MTNPLPSTSAIPLDAGQVLRVRTGTVNVFTAEQRDGHTGAWVHLAAVEGPSNVLGDVLDGAVLIASTLPGAQVELRDSSACHPDELATALRPGADALSALGRAREAVLRKAEADGLSDAHDAWLVRGALTELADSIPGHSDASAIAETPAVRAVRRLAQVVGLPADPVRLRGAVADAQVSGRDPIAALAAACDATVRHVQLPSEWWRSRGPALLVTNTATGAIAVAQPARRRYRLWDPVTGREVPLDARAAALLAPTAKLLQPLLDPRRPATLRDLMRLGSRGGRRSLAIVLLATALVAMVSSAIPVVSGRLTTAVASRAEISFPAVIAALFLVIVASTAVSAVRMFALLRLRTHFTATAAVAVWDRQMRLPMSWHKARTQNERLTDATAVDGAAARTSDSTTNALLDTTSIFGAIAGAFSVNAWIALTIAGILVARGVAEGLIARRLVVLAAESVAIDATSPALEILNGVTRLRASGALRRAYARWAGYVASRVQLSVRRGRLQTTLSVLSSLWSSLGLALLIAVIDMTTGARLNAETLGVLVTAQAALVSANASLAMAISSVGAVLGTRAILRRTEPILAAIPESAGGGEVAPLAGGIDLRGVVYRYGPDLPPIFNGVSLQIEPGEHLALVGPSGTGKTTLLRLILGLDDPEAGLVSFDGKDLVGLDKSAVRRQIGAVMQSSALLPGSIRENVDLGRGLSATDVWTALDQAAIGDDVRAMPMGLNTVVVEGGAGISGGQRQRILLARALAGSPRILVLDEATSALDNVSQAAVVANLDRLRITRIVVAHRLSTIEHADRVAVLDGGRIVQAGRFAELAAVEGPFRSLIERQSVDGLAPASS